MNVVMLLLRFFFSVFVFFSLAEGNFFVEMWHNLWIIPWPNEQIVYIISFISYLIKQFGNILHIFYIKYTHILYFVMNIIFLLSSKNKMTNEPLYCLLRTNRQIRFYIVETFNFNSKILANMNLDLFLYVLLYLLLPCHKFKLWF